MPNNLQGNDPKFVVNQAGVAELNIYDEIGFWGVDQNDFNRELSALNGEPLTVRISSNGGAVQDAIAMYNMLKDYDGTVTTINDSIAASAATIIYLAGDVRKASAISSFMTHKPMAGFYGNTDDVVEFTSMLHHYNGVIQSAYEQGGLDSDVAATMINSGDYWFNGETAAENGFVTELTEAAPVQNSVDLSKFANVPEFVLNKSLKAGATVQAVAASVKPPEKVFEMEKETISAADHELAVASAKKSAYADALERVDKVKNLESAKGREALADKLVSNAALSVDEIDEMLQSAPQAAKVENLQLSDELGDLSSKDLDDKPVDRVNAFAKSIGKEK